ncbi:hypothetical protein [Brevibacillus fulvus]|uniref:Uncharacterized protein n=1 Tax=Brevibacillus fulvus TaxID=1125967 RepID=A0A939BSR1_9BACL|nr:hypothetical protein [Brevibacillus fulvus]MBM7591002.1 hypothetical protein [Brevibacillus fulvus]
MTQSLAELQQSADELLKSTEPFAETSTSALLFNLGNSGSDIPLLSKQTSRLVDLYNQLVNKMSKLPAAEPFSTRMKTSLQQCRAQLEQLGIHADEQGLLALNQQQLNESATADFSAVLKALAGPTGWAGQLRQQALSWKQTPLTNWLSDGTIEHPYKKARLSSFFLTESLYSGLFFNQLF